jgi:L-lactate utilization protein LutB
MLTITAAQAISDEGGVRCIDSEGNQRLFASTVPISPPLAGRSSQTDRSAEASRTE